MQLIVMIFGTTRVLTDVINDRETFVSIGLRVSDYFFLDIHNLSIDVRERACRLFEVDIYGTIPTLYLAYSYTISVDVRERTCIFRRITIRVLRAIRGSVSRLLLLWTNSHSTCCLVFRL